MSAERASQRSCVCMHKHAVAGVTSLEAQHLQANPTICYIPPSSTETAVTWVTATTLAIVAPGPAAPPAPSPTRRRPLHHPPADAAEGRCGSAAKEHARFLVSACLSTPSLGLRLWQHNNSNPIPPSATSKLIRDCIDLGRSYCDRRGPGPKAPATPGHRRRPRHPPPVDAGGGRDVGAPSVQASCHASACASTLSPGWHLMRHSLTTPPMPPSPTSRIV